MNADEELRIRSLLAHVEPLLEKHVPRDAQRNARMEWRLTAAILGVAVAKLDPVLRATTAIASSPNSNS